MQFLNITVIISIFLLSSLNSLNGSPNQRRSTEIESNREFKDRQFLGFQQLGSFAGGNNAGNPFRQATVTRTIVRTVSTVTVVAFRTCTTTIAAFSACAGRRRREVGDAKEKIDPEQSLTVMVGTTTMTDPKQISSVLLLENDASQYIVGEAHEAILESSTEAGVPQTTVLYPSQESALVSQVDIENDSLSISTDTPILTIPVPIVSELDDNARINLAGTSTITVTISQTSIASTFATGTAATLSITYGGCSPATLPITTSACV